MDRVVKDKVVVITGGAQGLGLSIAESFLKNHARTVIITDLKHNAGSTAVADLNAKYGEGKAVFIKCDVTKDLEMVFNEIVNTYNTVDVLVNNAGGCREDSFKATIDLNLVALVEWSMKFFEHMIIRKGGKGGTILNVSSVYGFRIDPYLPYYIASKHAVIGFTRSKGHKRNFDKSGVRIVAICPGYTRTELTKGGNRKPEIEEFLKQVPWQDPAVVGEATVEIFKIANSGTVWQIENNLLSEVKEREENNWESSVYTWLHRE